VKTPWALIFLSLVMAAGCSKSSSESTTVTGVTAPGKADPAGGSVHDTSANQDIRLSIVNFDEIQQRVAQQRGKVVVMDAWSTSCPPCMKEFHHLVELHKKYDPQQLACMSLSFDYEGLDTPEQVQGPVLDFLRKQGATFENLMSNEESDVLYKKFKLAAVPAVFVYDRQGQLRKRFDNEQAQSKADAFTYEQVESLVAELLKETPPADQ